LSIDTGEDGGEKPLVQRGYMKLNIAADPSRNGGDTESSGAGNETVKGQ